MNSVGIDTFVKAAQEVSKPKPTSASGNSEFNDYLREAANVQPTAAKEQSAGKSTSLGDPAKSKTPKQDSAKSSDEQDGSGVEATEQTDPAQGGVVDKQQADSETDEVLLSVAAIAASAAEVVPLAKTSDVHWEVAPEATLAEVAKAQPAPESATGHDFLPDLEQALAEAEPSVNNEAVVTSETSQPVEATAGEAAVEVVEPQAIAEAPATIVAQVAASQQDEQPAAEQFAPSAEQTQSPVGIEEHAAEAKSQVAAEPVLKSENHAKEVDEHEPKAEKTTAVDKQAVAEQLATQVAAAIVESDSSHEAKLKATVDASTAPDLPTEPQVQQPSAPRETARTDAQMMHNEGDSRMPTIDRTRFVQRVANAFRSAQHNDGHIQMRLSPPELGALRIEIAVRNGVLTANLETETSDARRVLLDNLPALRQRLAEQDIRIEKFDVDVRREGSQSDGKNGTQDGQAQQQSQRAAAQNRIRTTAPAEVTSARFARPLIASAESGLDVRI